MKNFTFLGIRNLFLILLLFVSTTAFSQYCNSNGNNDYYLSVGRVQLNTIDNTSGPGISGTGYSDYTAMSTNLTRGTLYTITITTNRISAYPIGYRVWIDYNNDNDFADAGEQVFSTGTTTALTVSGSFTIPVGATLGNTRMRVTERYNALPSNCGSFNYGEVEDYTVNIVTSTPAPEINIIGLGNTINDGDTTPVVTDNTLYGSTSPGTPISHTFTIQNIGSLPLTIGAITFSGANPSDFYVLTPPAATIAASGSSNFVVNFDPSGNGTRTVITSIVNTDSNENPYDFTLQGTGVVPLTNGPGGVTADLRLWLKANAGLSYTSGQPVSLWADQGRGADATVNLPSQSPTYYDNVSRNVNFNPVVDFDNSVDPVPLDGDFSYDDASTQFLQGTSGLYTQDMFVVLIPDVTVNSTFGSMDVFCGDERPATNETDATGIGLGRYTVRFSNEILCYAVGTTSGGNGYGVAEAGTGSTYSNVGIINARNNTAATQQQLYYNAINKETHQNDIPDFSNVNNSRYWIGRSEGWEASTDARIVEIITYSARKTDANLTQERNRIQSYLAIKYGITLGVNGTSQDYVNSDGTVIWDQSANIGFNYDIAGIGRDDASALNQKQSRSVNNATDVIGRTQGLITMGLTDIYDTNNNNIASNPTTLNNKQFLVWGNNGANLNLAASVISVNMSAGISPPITTNTYFTGMQRVWKVVENGGDIPKVKISIPQNAIRNISPPGSYLMLISDSSVFDPTADYRIMTPDGFGNLTTEYDFDGTKYITFGFAPQVIAQRSVYFDGTIDYIDMEDTLDLNPTGFTVSAWAKREAGSNNTSIVSKRNNPYTVGYDFKIDNTGRLRVEWKNGGPTFGLTSSVVIPENEWHHLAIIYSSGVATLYIDGVADTSTALVAPTATDESFFVAAAGKTSQTQHYKGNIDEIRIWDRALTANQLRFLMNQEIQNNAGFVSGRVLPTTITKNEVAAIPWSDLAGYYPMTRYTYTNVDDESGNNHHGALKNLDTVDRQTAPLPYESTQNGNWDGKSTWTNGMEQTIPGAASIVNNNITIDWNIVKVNHNVSMDNSGLPAVNGGNRSVLGLYIDDVNDKLTVDGNTLSNTGGGLTVTHYLTLDGTIDLDGESQLVQTTGSDLDVTSAGKIERDQQGTADTYTYNYWSSPVGLSNTTSNNNDYTIANTIKDGTNPASPLTMSFTGGLNGTAGSPIGISNYWIWKFNNLPDDDYSSWVQVGSTGTMLAGEGYTMKGPGTGPITADQNYVYAGKPNNGDITLPLFANNDYLVGNPYPSAIDAQKFILDNGPTIDGALPSMTGTLYFWEHWGGGSHILSEYQGGYATYNMSGAVPSATLGVSDPDVSNAGTPTKLPGRYIPVSQGFFVVGENNGNITFNNSQRVFRKEGVATSVFLRNADANASTDEDTRMKFRIGFNSVNTIHRQLLLTIDENATSDVDWSYDGKHIDTQMDDMYWMINNEKYSIQAINTVNPITIVPLGLHTNTDGENNISIDRLENVPADIDILLHDTLTDTYHDLRLSNYVFNLPSGEYLDRYELVFGESAETLTVSDNELNDITIYYANDTEHIVLLNPKLKDISSIEMLNMLGQTIHKVNTVASNEYSEYEVKNLSTGSYILKINTVSGSVSKKVLVQ
ncbi:MAG: choice-of-anchor D domain-containing protein [Gelidibacter sp.]|nr:choice-of-anchor D domain-containing protein [Gelidibacter sp.]